MVSIQLFTSENCEEIKVLPRSFRLQIVGGFFLIPVAFVSYTFRSLRTIKSEKDIDLPAFAVLAGLTGLGLLLGVFKEYLNYRRDVKEQRKICGIEVVVSKSR